MVGEVDIGKTCPVNDLGDGCGKTAPVDAKGRFGAAPAPGEGGLRPSIGDLPIHLMRVAEAVGRRMSTPLDESDLLLLAGALLAERLAEAECCAKLAEREAEVERQAEVDEGENAALDIVAAIRARWAEITDGTAVGESTDPDRADSEVRRQAEMDAWMAEHDDAGGRVVVSEDISDTHALSLAAVDVLAERRRQVEVEGWTAKYDDKHGSGDLAAAGGCYALGAAFLLTPGLHYSEYVPAEVPRLWPWDARWWKLDGRDPRRALVKAGALILAEIERLDRGTPQSATTATSGLPAT